LRRKGCTYRENVRILHELDCLDVAVSTIHSFIKVRAKHKAKHKHFWVLGLPAKGKQHRIHQAQLSHNQNLRLPMRRHGLFRSAARSTTERRSHRQGVCNWLVDVLESLVSALTPPTRTTSLALQFAGKYNKM
jgi:hypothetical protein